MSGRIVPSGPTSSTLATHSVSGRVEVANSVTSTGPASVAASGSGSVVY